MVGHAKSAPIRRWKCICAYDGGGFHGWQSQPGGRAVQDVIERRLQGIFGRPVRIHGSGRTDAGVHARGQVFHFDAAWPHGAAKLLAALRAGLPPTIQIRSARAVSRRFHARYSAAGKTYSYCIRQGGRADPFLHAFCWSLPQRLDVAAMRRAARRLTGRHDFRAFAAAGSSAGGDTVRHLRRLDLTGRGARLRVVAEGDGFLYKMVRRLVGALVAVGRGKLGAEEVAAILRAGRQTNAFETAPAAGLFLERVRY